MDYEKKNKNFNDWLKDYITTTKPSYSNNTKKMNKSLLYHNNNLVEKKTFVNNFVDELTTLVTSNGHTINNDKQFRNEIASFIYKYSNK
tara:strand:+ start:307 stop:573 length:267 start_codon:yes stop_codon:yes gene_type:complete